MNSIKNLFEFENDLSDPPHICLGNVTLLKKVGAFNAGVKFDKVVIHLDQEKIEFIRDKEVKCFELMYDTGKETSPITLELIDNGSEEKPDRPEMKSEITKQGAVLPTGSKK